jgi:hypothetical protein
MKKTIVFLTLLFSQLVWAQSSVLKQGTWSYPKAASGECLQDLTQETTRVMEAHGIRTKNIPFGKVQKIADAMVLMDNLYGARVPFFEGVQIKLDEKFNHLGKQVSDTQIIVGSIGSQFVNIYIHELSHKLGNSEKNGSKIYSQYNKFVTQRCLLTRYSKASHGNGVRNEEFAEAFTGYLLMPEELLKGSLGCKLAHEYFAKRLFPAQKHTCKAK